MIRQFELVERLKSYDPHTDEDLVNRAYVFSMKAHGTQTRASGDPYFSHPLEVAGLLTEMRLDSYSIITALLHDTVEDTLTTIEEIETLFGSQIAKLVDGVTKLSRLELQSEQIRQAENFRKLLLAMSDDIRVLLVKLADRLHNMRTLHYFKDKKKRRRIAQETLEIYAPLAERIGIHRIKDELEDLAFLQLYPDTYATIKNQLQNWYHLSGDAIEKILKDLRRVTMDAGLVNCQISGRNKTPYSIWHKMQRKNITLEELADIIAFRIIVDNVTECYQALGIIHSHYTVIPGRFKDYISTPKPNRYQSLHTSLIGPLSQRIEVQIRTHDMHEVCELGVAAHWQYKRGGNSHDGKQYAWLRSLLEILDHASGPEEFLEHTKLEMFQDEVFCFTPKGEVIALPKGACIIDFAYAIHSAIGDAATGAKVNGKQVPLRTILHNGDQVDVITSKNQIPSPAWDRFVVTGKARAKIQRFTRTQRREQFLELGKSLFFKSISKENLEFSEKILKELVHTFQLIELDDIYVSVGEGTLGIREIIRCYRQKLDPNHVPKDTQKPIENIVTKTIPSINKTDSLKGLIPGTTIRYANCCHPVPGDKIVGVVMAGKGTNIHNTTCEMLSRIKNKDRILDLSWDMGINRQTYTGKVKVIFINKAGGLTEATTIIGQHGSNLLNVKLIHRSTDLWEMLFDIEVKNLQQLEAIIASLRTLNIVSLVERI